MGQQSLLKFETFFHFGILILIFTFLVESVPLPDWRYEACKPRNCGSGPNISYPFQVNDDQANFWGYPGFSVVCEESKPVYSTSCSKYIIEDIFYTNQSFKLVDVEVINSTCPIPLRIFAFDLSSFEFGPNFIDLYLFYNCTNSFPVKYKQFPIACASNPSYHSFAVLDPKDESFNVTDMPCESFTSEPVELEGGTYDRTVQTVDYKKLLTNGFTLDGVELVAQSVKEVVVIVGSITVTLYVSALMDHTSNVAPMLYLIRGCVAGTTMGLVIKTAIAASTAGMAVLITLALCFRRKFTLGESMAFWKKKTKNLQDIEAFLKNYGSLAPKRYSHANVKKMTESFKCKLGQGGYGCVYKGKLHDGGLVAVKVLNESKGSGEEFINEVASISRTSHINIVTLLRFCFDGSKRALI
ncbi:hypothetical protein F0562_032708 [Nyssa sinensis]|uniref:Protein kinase domain-containing protein n=1 Tax=Nyssa sinensis TaxID=561372 RepID=A0A5J5ANH9_9ASTE|nr:hypothetical protein F0562_032708 [Nyssa sinensis]